jgi:hypothetical protein
VGHIRLLLVLAGLSLVWIVFAKLIVPPVIESGYAVRVGSFFQPHAFQWITELVLFFFGIIGWHTRVVIPL